jgi:UDP-N-acetylglucosamine:LPS N-acetylglucosamine transferase
MHVMKQRILILAISAGGGHKSAADALAQAIDRTYPGKFDIVVDDFYKQIRMVTGLDRIVEQAYAVSVRSFKSYPYKWLFKLGDKTGSNVNKLLATLFEEQIGGYLQKQKPDLIISTYCGIGHAVDEVIKAGQYRRVPIVTLITDSGEVNRWWLAGGDDAFLVSTPDTIEYAVKHGVNKSALHYLGFPINPAFGDLPDKVTARKQLGLEKDLPTVLLTAGGTALNSKLLSIAKRLSKLDLPGQFIFVAGKNTKFEEALRQLEYKSPTKVFGFVTNMPELMAASDFMVGKAGWVTLYEALVARLPVIINSVIPGQEEPNAKFVQRHKVGLVLTQPKDAIEAITDLVEHPEKLEPYRRNLEKLGLDAKAGERIARFLVEEYLGARV